MDNPQSIDGSQSDFIAANKRHEAALATRHEAESNVRSKEAAYARSQTEPNRRALKAARETAEWAREDLAIAARGVEAAKQALAEAELAAERAQYAQACDGARLRDWQTAAAPLLAEIARAELARSRALAELADLTRRHNERVWRAADLRDTADDILTDARGNRIRRQSPITRGIEPAHPVHAEGGAARYVATAEHLAREAAGVPRCDWPPAPRFPHPAEIELDGYFAAIVAAATTAPSSSDSAPDSTE